MMVPTTQSNADLSRMPSRPGSHRKILFASAHSIVDFSNGASVATLDVLQGLTTHGFDCQAFCTPKLDTEDEVCFEKIISQLREPYQLRESVCGSKRRAGALTQARDVPITVVRLPSTRHVRQSPEEVQTVLRFFEKFLDINPPDVLLTYGGDAVTIGMIQAAKRRRIPVVFFIHNFAYVRTNPFALVDYCIVPAKFTQQFYRDWAGVNCHAISYPIDWERVRVQEHDRRFVTFITPMPAKGVYPFARIAAELGRRRPDIPLLVVESRAKRNTLAACGIDPSARVNLDVMRNTTDPRRFWSRTKIALLPSLWFENQPLAAIEAMINGIPVIGSNRGGIPETLGNAGVVLPLPDRLTPATRILPAAEEMEPWVESIIRLWDDQARYDELSRKARQEAERWHPDRLRPLWAEFFRNVQLQAGPPLVPGFVRNPRTGEPSAIHVQASAASAPPGFSTTKVDASLGPLAPVAPTVQADVIPLSFVACVCDDAVLKSNLMASPIFHAAGTPHEVILIHKAPTPAPGSTQASSEPSTGWWCACTRTWSCPMDGIANSPASSARPSSGLARSGLLASTGSGRPFARHRRRAWPWAPSAWAGLSTAAASSTNGPSCPPAPPRSTNCCWSSEGTDRCGSTPRSDFTCTARTSASRQRRGGWPWWCWRTLPPQFRSRGLPKAFYASAATFARKWAHRLPVATSCVIIDRDGKVCLLGNTPFRRTRQQTTQRREVEKIH